MKKFLNIFGFLLILGVCNSHGQTNLETRINKILKDQRFKHANASISVIDLDNKNTYVDINGEKSLIPASSLKLLTTFTALDLLGEDYVYKTRITHSGKLDPDGTLTGNIYIEGSGDPTLGSDRISGVRSLNDLLKEVLSKIKAYGITCIDGKIIADESIYDSYPISPSWQWNDLGNYYASGSWGININENTYTIYYDTKDAIGNVAALHSYYPFIPSITFENEVTIDSVGTGDNAYIFGGPYEFRKRIVGTLPYSKKLFAIKGAIPDPPLFTAYSIWNKLQVNQITSAGYKTQFHNQKSKSKRKLIYTITSPSLKEISKYANLKSINIYCESLLKSIGYEIAKDGKGSQGIRMINKQLKKYNINSDGLHMEDGSGLSARNLVNSRLLAEFLKVTAKSNGLANCKKLLPRAGVSGTMAYMLSGYESQKHVWAKTGSMEKVLSYTGYCDSKSGRKVAFSIIINGFHRKNKEMKSKINEMLDAIYRFAK